MRYIIGYDVDNNNIFDQSDQYTSGVDSLFPVIQLNNLSFGRYRVVVETSKGCDLNQIDFVILNCFTLLATNINHLTAIEEGDQHLVQWTVSGNSTVEFFDVEASKNGNDFYSIARVNRLDRGDRVNYEFTNKNKAFQFYRIKITTREGHTILSAITQVPSKESSGIGIGIYPNPLKSEMLTIENKTRKSLNGNIEFYSSNGLKVLESRIVLYPGQTTAKVNLVSLAKGFYYVVVRDQMGYRLLSATLLKSD